VNCYFSGIILEKQEGPNYQTDYRNSTAKDMLEDSRRHEKAVGESGTLKLLEKAGQH
jgi:hypothetical protein